MNRLGRGVLLVVALCVGVGVWEARAQGDVPADGPDVGLSIARAALVDLRLQPEIQTHDYEIAQQLLGLALEFSPDEPEVVRHRIEAATGAGRKDLIAPLTRTLVSLDPSDTVAQLRLITSQLAGRQTADGRLAVYERLLGSGGTRLDDALRSRLALDAALLARELGNEELFARLLTSATALDMTNKEAASLALSFFGERVDDPVGTADLMVNLLLSDPIDPNVMWMLYEHALRFGAFDAALRMSDLIGIVLGRDGQPPDPQLGTDRLVLVWWLTGPEALVDQLNTRLEVERYRAGQALAAAEAQGVPTEDLTRPEEVFLPFDAEEARVFAAVTVEDEATIDAAFEDLLGATDARIDQINTRQRGGNPLPPAQARLQTLIVLYERFSLQGMMGRDPEDLDVGLATLRAGLEGDPTLLVTLELWADVANGRFEEAAGRLEGVDVRRLPPLGAVAAIKALRGAGRDSEGLELAAAFARAQPATPAGAWAWTQYRAAQVEAGAELERVTLFEETDAIRARVLSLPGWLEEMVSDPRRFLALAVELVEPTIGPMGEARVRVRLRNTGRIPLAVGGSRPVDSSVLISPRLITTADDGGFIETPEVLVLSRKLRLMPREELVAEVWADAGNTGLFAHVDALAPVRARWRVLQGFRYDGTYGVGPFGLSSDSQVLLRLRFEEAGLAADELVEMAASGDVLRAAAVTRALLAADASERSIAGEDFARVAEAFAGRYPRLPRAERAYLIATLPHAKQHEGFGAFDDVVLEAEEDGGLLGLAIALRVREGDHAVMERALALGDADISALVSAVRARLALGEETGLAHIGPGFEGAFQRMGDLE